MSALQELIASLDTPDPGQRQEIYDKAMDLVGRPKFIPNPGAQTDAYLSDADILLAGGQPYGGKSALLIGLALNEHRRSLIVRKQFSHLEGIVENAIDIVGSSEGFVRGQRPHYKKSGGGIIRFEGTDPNGRIDPGKQGTPYDFIGVDEGAQLPRDTIRALIGWNRTTANNPGQRCRIVIASNPPLDTVGDWIVEDFAPWLDPGFLHPAQPGELRWCFYDDDDNIRWCDGPEPVVIDGKSFSPHSRSFIPYGIDDNPFADREDYDKRLQAMPEPFRSILRSGNFMFARQDHEQQVIPTAWIMEAQARWAVRPPEGVAMTAMAQDCAGGGKDPAVTCWRYGGWFGEMDVAEGEVTDNGPLMAARITANRRDNCPVVVDMGGGYGGRVAEALKDNGIVVVKYKGGTNALGTALGSNMRFANKRAESVWRMMEALDPSQEGGSVIAFPPDPQLRSDLASYWFLPRPMFDQSLIKLESKEEMVKRIGRSPNKGDAAIMCLAEGGAAAKRALFGNNNQTRAVLGHQAAKRRRR